MDFGNILDKWEKQKTATVSEAPPPQANPMDVWLRTNKVFDKDAEAVSPQASAQEKRRRLKNKRPDAELDIHGQTRDEAWLSLEGFFAEAKKQGFEKVLVIHGKGNHSAGGEVLKSMVKDFLERCPIAGESGRGKASAGGEGATWVLIK